MEREVRRRTILGLAGLALAAAWLGCRARPEEAGSPEAPARTEDSNALHLLFTYGSEKEEWIEEVTARLNTGGHRTASGKPIQVEAVAQVSGELIEDLLAGARQAHLTSPASAAFIKLGNARSRARAGKDLIGETRNLCSRSPTPPRPVSTPEERGRARRPAGRRTAVRSGAPSSSATPIRSTVRRGLLQDAVAGRPGGSPSTMPAAATTGRPVTGSTPATPGRRHGSAAPRW